MTERGHRVTRTLAPIVLILGFVAASSCRDNPSGASAGSSSGGALAGNDEADGGSIAGAAASSAEGGLGGSETGERCAPAQNRFGDVLIERLDYAGLESGSCPEGEPTGRFTLQSVDWILEEGSTTEVNTRFTAILQGAQSCRIRMRIRLRGEKVLFEAGDVLDISERTTTRDFEHDVIESWAFRTAAGELRLAFTRDARSAVFDKDLLGFDMGPEEEICSFANGQVLHRVSVNDGSLSCTAESFTRSCCVLFDKDYELRIDYSGRVDGAKENPRTVMLVTASGLLGAFTDAATRSRACED